MDPPFVQEHCLNLRLSLFMDTLGPGQMAVPLHQAISRKANYLAVTHGTVANR